jgi:hypothetical protein
VITSTKAKNVKRMDALLAQSLARFRRTLLGLTREELVALDARIDLLAVKQRWARGSHGLERHRSRNELGRLARRQTEVRRELAARTANLAPVTQLAIEVSGENEGMELEAA